MFLRRFLAIAGLILCLFSSVTLSANRLLITNGLILTMKPGDQPFHGYLLIDDKGRITAINHGNPPATYTARTLYNAHGKILLPGSKKC